MIATVAEKEFFFMLHLNSRAESLKSTVSFRDAMEFLKYVTVKTKLFILAPKVQFDRLIAIPNGYLKSDPSKSSYFIYLVTNTGNNIGFGWSDFDFRELTNIPEEIVLTREERINASIMDISGLNIDSIELSEYKYPPNCPGKFIPLNHIVYLNIKPADSLHNGTFIHFQDPNLIDEFTEETLRMVKSCIVDKKIASDKNIDLKYLDNIQDLKSGNGPKEMVVIKRWELQFAKDSHVNNVNLVDALNQQNIVIDDTVLLRFS